jgi:hypothetical protein
MDDLTEALDKLLKKAGIPNENELFGKHFAITFTDDTKERRMSGAILGTDFTDGVLRLITTPLLKDNKRGYPVICWHESTWGGWEGWAVSYKYTAGYTESRLDYRGKIVLF